jgi:imidazolonepropionase-like amidohydrolase
MKKIFKWLGVFLMSCFGLSAFLLTIGVNLPLTHYTQKEPIAAKLLIKNCHIVDVKNGTILSNHNIRIENGKIIAIDSVGSSSVAGFTVIDGSGKYVMPGLWDMHLHTLSLSPQLHFPLLIANGVTNVRDMGDGDSWISDIDAPLVKDKDSWDKQFTEQHLLMPRIWESCSYHVEEIDGITAQNTQEKVRELVTKLKQRGEPFVKLQLEDSELPAPVFYEIQKQAQLQGFSALGHLSYNVDIDTVLANGYPSIEHAWALIPHCVREKKRFEKDLETKAYELSHQDTALTTAVLKKIAAAHTYYVPTHVTSNRKEALVFDEKFRQDPRNQYVESTQLRLWKLWANLHTSGYDEPAQQELLYNYYQRGLEITRLAHQNGVKLLAGTDALDRYVYHGFSLHDELTEMTKAGLTPAEALRTATINAAEYYRQTDKYGSVEPGKTADLLLLDRNPLENITNTQAIHAVYFNQRLYDRNDLARMKASVREQAKSFGISCKFIWNMIKGMF